MSPTAVAELRSQTDIISDVKANVAHVENAERPPLADDYMYDFQYNHSLPTLDVLGVDIPADTDATEEAIALTAQLAEILATGDHESFANLFLDYGVWRDKLSFTWDYRTFNFRESIAKAARDLLPSTCATNVRLFTPSPSVERPYPDLAFLQFTIAFDTALVHGSAVINAVKTTEGWKLWTMHTVAEDLIDFPELPPVDGHMTGAVSWENQRAKDDDEIQPDVLIIGGGQK